VGASVGGEVGGGFVGTGVSVAVLHETRNRTIIKTKTIFNHVSENFNFCIGNFLSMKLSGGIIHDKRRGTSAPLLHLLGEDLGLAVGRAAHPLRFFRFSSHC